MMTNLMLLLVLTSFSVVTPTDSVSQAPEPDAQADTVRVHRAALHPRFKFYPTALYTSSQGFGVGVGLEVENVTGDGSSLTLTAKPAQHRGIYSATYYTADPASAATYGLLSLYYHTTSRQRYYGIGPATTEDGKINLNKAGFEAEARVGTYLAGRRVLLQPNVQWQRHDTREFAQASDGALMLLDTRSMTNLGLVTSDSGNAFSGFSLGLDAAYDTRNQRDNPSRGWMIAASARRFGLSTLSGLTFDTYGFNAYHFIPLGRKGGVLSLRTMAVLTRNRGTAPIPFYMLPTLDRELMPGYSRNRFYGNDLLSVGAEYRRQLFKGLGNRAVEGTILLSAGNAYDDLFRQFRPDISFQQQVDPAQHRFPLRPALGIGARLISLHNNRVSLQGMIGFSPEGFDLVSFRFVHDLSRPRLPGR